MYVGGGIVVCICDIFTQGPTVIKSRALDTSPGEDSNALSSHQFVCSILPTVIEDLQICGAFCGHAITPVDL